jgi:iron-sulfur cluster assembly protein
MIDVTPYAVEILTGYLNAKAEAIGVRLSVKGGGCSGYEYDIDFVTHSTPLDKSFQFGGVKLYIDQASLLYLDGTTIDFQQTLMGGGFVFNNPLAVRGCGCGKSFSV